MSYLSSDRNLCHAAQSCTPESLAKTVLNIERRSDIEYFVTDYSLSPLRETSFSAEKISQFYRSACRNLESEECEALDRKVNPISKVCHVRDQRLKYHVLNPSPRRPRNAVSDIRRGIDCHLAWPRAKPRGFASREIPSSCTREMSASSIQLATTARKAARKATRNSWCVPELVSAV